MDNETLEPEETFYCNMCQREAWADNYDKELDMCLDCIAEQRLKFAKAKC